MIDKIRRSSSVARSTNGVSEARVAFVRAMVLAAALFAACWLLLVGMRALDASDFMLIAWEPGHELLAGRGVPAGYPYPLWTVVVMLPFVLWSPAVAMLLWFSANVVMLALSVCLLMRLFDVALSPLRIALFVPVVAYFLPTLTSLWLGQLTIFSLLMLIAVAEALRRRAWWWVGVWLGLSLIKPQVTILVTGGILLWALWTRRWQIIAGFAAVVAALTAISLPFIAAPQQLIGGGISEHLVEYISKTSTIWALCLVLGAPLVVPAAISALLLGWLAWTWWPVVFSTDMPKNFNYLISVATIVNLVVVPYSWLHNLLLLLFPLAYGLATAWKLHSTSRVVWFLVLLGIMHPFFLIVYFGLSMPLDLQTYQVIPALVLLPTIVLLHRKSA